MEDYKLRDLRGINIPGVTLQKKEIPKKKRVCLSFFPLPMDFPLPMVGKEEKPRWRARLTVKVGGKVI